jgi:hypothetical protein
MELIVAGLVGAAVGAAVVWLTGRRRRGMGASYRFTDKSRPWPSWPKSPNPEEREQMKLRQDPLLLIDRSPLRRVVGVGQTLTADGATVECIAIELRDDGGRGLLRSMTPGGRHIGTESVGQQPIDPVPRLEDDLGTAYAVTMPQWRGDEYSSEMLFRFTPVPPAEARQLVIRAPRAWPYGPSNGASTEDWWSFEVDLTAR